MKQKAASLLACTLLAACSGGSNPFTQTGSSIAPGADAPPGGTASVPEAIAGNLKSARFDAATGTLVVEGVNLDEVPFTATYTRAPALDQDGYVAFTVQEDPLDRHFTAYAGQSTSGAVRAVAVSSPGPRNRSFMGALFDRDGTYDPPPVGQTTGLVTYAGGYVGVTNLGDVNGSDLLPPGVTDPELLVPQALIVHGDAFLNADFADNAVEGNIFNRELLNTDLNPISDLPSVALTITEIGADGSFSGTAEYDLSDPLSGASVPTAIGTYAGVFGGTDSDSVAGGLQLNEFDGVSDNLGYEAELETGVFVLDQCGLTGVSPICANVNPDAGTP